MVPVDRTCISTAPGKVLGVLSATVCTPKRRRSEDEGSFDRSSFCASSLPNRGAKSERLPCSVESKVGFGGNCDFARVLSTASGCLNVRFDRDLSDRPSSSSDVDCDSGSDTGSNSATKWTPV